MLRPARKPVPLTRQWRRQPWRDARLAPAAARGASRRCRRVRSVGG